MVNNDKYNAITNTQKFVEHLQELLVTSQNWVILSNAEFDRVLESTKEKIHEIVEDNEHFWKILEGENLINASRTETAEYSRYQSLDPISKFFTQLPVPLYEITKFSKVKLLKEKAIQVLENLDEYKTIYDVNNIYHRNLTPFYDRERNNFLASRMLYNLIPDYIYDMITQTEEVNVNIEYINNLLMELSAYKYDQISIGQDMMTRIRELEDI